MRAIIITVGSELTSGQTVDTNSAYLARRLAERGILAWRHVTVGDELSEISQAISQAAASAELVLVAGGLGPTADDLTREALAQVLGQPLELNQRSLAHIEEFFRARGRTMNESNRAQAMVPRGAEPLDNPLGTAGGMAATLGGARIYVMPGVPYEMEGMFCQQVAPRLGAGPGAIVHHVLHTFGRGESDVGAAIADLMRRGANPQVGTTVAAGMVSIRVTSSAPDALEAETLAAGTLAEIRRRLGTLIVCQDDQTMAWAVGRLLRRAGQTLAVAESCTGGMLGQMVTSVAGSSEYFLGGVVSYANATKVTLLGVDEQLLLRHGAVSEPVAAAMAEACRRRLGSDWALSITGIAGPGGGTAEKPVGLVYVSLAGRSGVQTRRLILPGTRDIIRLRASLSAMDCLRLELMKG